MQQQTVDVDYWRQLDLFRPGDFKIPITVIGAGATGSYIVWLLAKMGCADITVYDFDVVENHNLPNQMFGIRHVGEKKVEALRELVEAGTGIKIKTIADRFTAGALRGIVFVLTDTMASRKEIWQKSVRYNINVALMIETRMAADGGLIYAIRPTMPREVVGYESTLYADEEAEESPCSRRAIAPTVATIAGLAVFTMLNFVNHEQMPHELLLSLMPPMVITRNFT